MGREWYWSSRSQRSGQTEGESPPAGCMSGVLQLFDLHQLLFTTPTRSADLFPENHHEPELHKVQGVEAPRSSLELNEATASSGPAIAGEMQYDIPIGIRLVPRKKTVGDEEERGSLQGTGTRTGNVVARLMGLEQLPDTASSPHMNHCHQDPLISPPPIRSEPQHSKKKRYTDTCSREGPLTPPPRLPLQARSCNAQAEPVDVIYGTTRGFRSLPETPRVSVGRMSWDADPRLSLQASNKENCHLTSAALKRLNCFCEVPGDCSPSPSPKLRKDWKLPLEENKSPGHYAREIVKQVKDSVSRRIGGRDCDDPTIKSKVRTKGHEKKAGKEQLNRSKASTLKSCSPNLKFAESPKNRYFFGFSQDLMPNPPRLASPSIPSETRNSVKTKKSGSERFTERLKKPPPAAVRREVFASTPLMSPSLVPTKRIESLTELTLPAPSQPRARSNGNASPGPEELLYVKCILERADMVQPVDPTIFHQLELFYSSASGALRLRSNRKLLFHLVDEILGDLLWPDHRNTTTNDSRRALEGEYLLRQLWSRIQSFPSADCHVMQDIDALVDGDLSSTNVRRLLLHPTVVEEANSVVLEVERAVFDSLVGDAAAGLLASRNGVPVLERRAMQ